MGTRPGIGTALAVIPFLALLAAVRYEWWEYPSPAHIFLEFGTLLLAILGLAVVGVVWIVRSCRYWKLNRRLPRTAVVAPLLVMSAAVAFAVVDVPTDGDFDRANGQTEALAKTMLADGNRRLGLTEIDGVRFSNVYVGNDSCVYFVDSRRSDSLERAGWLYTAQCTPDPNTLRTLGSPAENWVAYRQGS